MAREEGEIAKNANWRVVCGVCPYGVPTQRNLGGCERIGVLESEMCEKCAKNAVSLLFCMIIECSFVSHCRK